MLNNKDLFLEDLTVRGATANTRAAYKSDLEDFDKAYKCFYEGNLITKQNLNFSIAEEKKIFENSV